MIMFQLTCSESNLHDTDQSFVLKFPVWWHNIMKGQKEILLVFNHNSFIWSIKTGNKSWKQPVSHTRKISCYEEYQTYNTEHWQAICCKVLKHCDIKCTHSCTSEMKICKCFFSAAAGPTTFLSAEIRNSGKLFIISLSKELHNRR